MKITSLVPQRFFGKNQSNDVTSDFMSPFHSLQRDIDDIFNNFYHNTPFSKDSAFIPSFDVEETKEKYIIKSEIPGVKDDDIKINLHENILSVEGKKEHKKETKDSKMHRIESTYGSFSRSIELPKNIDKDSISATFKNGVLAINIDKATNESSSVKEIPILYE